MSYNPWNTGVFDASLPTLVNGQTAPIQLTDHGEQLVVVDSSVTVVQPVGANLHAVLDAGIITSITNPVTVIQPTSANLNANVQIFDFDGDEALVTSYSELLTVEPIRLAGGVFNTTTVDPNFWATTLVGSGTVTQANSQQTAATGATANSSAAVSSVSIARYVGSNENRYIARVQMGDTGTVNNVRRWGAFTGTNGAYFKLSGATMYVATMLGGVETAIASTSWNGSQTVPTLTNLNQYIIEYTTNKVEFIINNVVAHTAVFATAPWTATPHLPTFMDNTNSGGLGTNLTITARLSAIQRLGRYETQPKYSHISTATTTICKYGPGSIHKITINTPVTAGSDNVTIYDNTAGSGTVIGIISLPSGASGVTLLYDLPFNTGLTIVTVGAWDLTVIYE